MRQTQREKKGGPETLRPTSGKSRSNTQTDSGQEVEAQVESVPKVLSTPNVKDQGVPDLGSGSAQERGEPIACSGYGASN